MIWFGTPCRASEFVGSLSPSFLRFPQRGQLATGRLPYRDGRPAPEAAMVRSPHRRGSVRTIGLFKGVVSTAQGDAGRALVGVCPHPPQLTDVPRLPRCNRARVTIRGTESTSLLCTPHPRAAISRQHHRARYGRRLARYVRTVLTTFQVSRLSFFVRGTRNEQQITKDPSRPVAPPHAVELP